MTHIWVPRTRIIEPKDAIAMPTVGIGGFIRAIRIGPDGKERWRSPWSKNLWTDNGLDAWLSALDNTTLYGQVGTGNSTPTVADNALQAPVASTTSVASQTYNLVDPKDGTPFYGYETRRYTFNPQSVSHNITEFGVRFGSTLGKLLIRSLFRDVNGAPTAVGWVAGETLLVDHQTRYYGSPADVTGQLTMGSSGVTHDLLLRPLSVSGAGGFINSSAWYTYPVIGAGNYPVYPYTDVTDLDGYTTTIKGTVLISSEASKTVLSYNPGSFYRELQCVWVPSRGNTANGLQAFSVSSLPGSHKVQFTPAIMKTDLDTLTLVFSSPRFSQYP